MKDHPGTSRGLRGLALAALLLVGLVFTAGPVLAQSTQTVENGCMEEVAQFGLNCTANDVQIAGVATDPASGEPLLEILDDGCAYPGDEVTFSATFEVVLNAQTRHDIGVYFATDGDMNGDGAVTGECTISTVPYEPEPDFLDLDMDQDGGFCDAAKTIRCETDRDCKATTGVCTPELDTCGDIDDAHNPLFPVITITTECIDPDGNRTLNLPNCTSWRQPGANELCLGPLDAYPGSPSKCRCDIGFEVPIEVPPAELRVVKTADPEQIPEPGGDVTFTVSVTNESPFATLTLTEIADDEDNDGVDDVFYDPAAICATTVLGPGESTECTFTRTVTGNAGDTLTDRATATGDDSEGNTVSGSDDATVTITDVPAVPLSIVKSVTSEASLPEPGGDFDFQVVVTNESVVDTATVTDLDDTYLADLQANGSCVDGDGDTVAPWELSPGESMTCTFTVSHTGQPATFDNNVTVKATDDDGADIGGVSNTVTVEITDAPAVPLSIVKSVTSAASLPEPGGEFDFQVVVTNPSDVETVTVTDLDDTYLADLQTSGSCVDGDGDTTVPWELSPGESLTCTFTVSHTGQPASFNNNVTVAATDDDGADVGGVSNTVTVRITDAPAVPLSIVKSVTSDSSLPEPGGDFDFQVVVTNNSAVDTATVTDLDDTYLADLQTNGSCADGGGNTAAPWELSPGESLTCTFTVSHTGQPATFDNNVTVAATDDDGADVGGVSNTVIVEITDVPAVPLGIVKSVTSASSLPEPGGDFNFQVVVTNNSEVDTVTVTDLDDTYLADLQNNGSCSDGDGDTVAPWELSPGESLTCTFTVNHTGEPDTFDNNVTVTATDDDGADVGGVSNTVTVEVTDVVPTASLVKTAATAAVTYTVVVYNQSNAEALSVDSLIDDKFGNVADPANPLLVSTACSVPQVLQPKGQTGDSYTCSFVGDVDAVDAPHTNTVTGTVSDNDGPTPNTVTPSDSATVNLID